MRRLIFYDYLGLGVCNARLAFLLADTVIAAGVDGGNGGGAAGAHAQSLCRQREARAEFMTENQRNAEAARGACSTCGDGRREMTYDAGHGARGEHCAAAAGPCAGCYSLTEEEDGMVTSHQAGRRIPACTCLRCLSRPRQAHRCLAEQIQDSNRNTSHAHKYTCRAACTCRVARILQHTPKPQRRSARVFTFHDAAAIEAAPAVDVSGVSCPPKQREADEIAAGKWHEGARDLGRGGLVRESGDNVEGWIGRADLSQPPRVMMASER
jgi:hypothetical protein